MIVPDKAHRFCRDRILNQIARDYSDLGPDEWHRTCSGALRTYQDWCELFDELKPNGTKKGYAQ